MDEQFVQRLAQLRIEKGVSARDMSLSIGQSADYINNIENGNNLPSMAAFFYICEYLNIPPRDFFDFDSKTPARLNDIIADLKQLDSEKLEHISAIVKDVTR